MTVEPDGRVEIAIQPDPTDARVDVRLQVHLVTTSGLALTPLSLDFGQALALPSHFPLVEPRDTFDLGNVVKTKPASRDLTLVGSPDGPTQVCLGAATIVHVPAAAGGTQLDYPSGCVDLQTGETKQVTVSVTPSAAAVGNGEGAIPIKLVSAPVPDQATTEFDLPVTWRFLNPTNYWITFIVAGFVAVVSLLPPLIAIIIARWWAARYAIKGLRATSVDVVLSRDAMRRADPLEGLPGRIIDTLELAPVPRIGSSPRRSFEYSGIRFRSKVPPSLVKPPRFWAEPPTGMSIAASTAQPEDPEDGSSVTTTPGLGFVAILLASPADLADTSGREIPARLIVLTTSRETDGALLDVKATGSLDVADFRRRVRDASPDADPDAFADSFDEDFVDGD